MRGEHGVEESAGYDDRSLLNKYNKNVYKNICVCVHTVLHSTYARCSHSLARLHLSTDMKNSKICSFVTQTINPSN